MKIIVLSKIEYKGCPAVLMQFRTTFQYIFEFGGEMYQDHMFMRPNWWRWVLWVFRVREFPYSDEQFKAGKEVLLGGIVRSIDGLGDPEEVARRRAAQEKRKKGARDSKCLWQTFTFEDPHTKEKIPMYHCLTHKQDIKMTEDYPKHE